MEAEEWEEGEEGSVASAALSEEEYQEFLQGVTERGVQGGGEEIKVKPEGEGKPKTKEGGGEEGDKVAGPESKQEGREGGGSAEPTAAGVGETQAQEMTSEDKVISASATDSLRIFAGVSWKYLIGTTLDLDLGFSAPSS